MSRRPVAILLTCLLAGSCDPSSLTDFELVPCDPVHDNERVCEPLNEREGIGLEVCHRYQCAKDGKGGCRLSAKDTDGDGVLDPVCATESGSDRSELDCDDGNASRNPTRSEQCDGIDNDCDLAIDEGAITVQDTVDHDTHPRPAQSIRYGRTGTLTASVADAEIMCTRGEPTSPSFAENCEATVFALAGDASVRGRPVSAHPCPLDGIEEARCNLASLVLGETGSGYLAAAVNVVGCPQGQLRLGVVDDLEAPDFEVGSGNTQFGVDVTEEMPSCSGASRQDPSLGATRPHLATQHPEGWRGQGLVAWLGDALDRDGCGGGAVAVEALGVWLVADPLAVQGTDGGLPQTLGTTTGGGTPAIEVWEGTGGSRGYFVGHGDAGGDAVALRFVPRLDRLVVADGEDLAAMDTPSLDLGDAFRVPAADGTADHVAFARSDVRSVCDGEGSGIELGVAWLEGCGGAEATVRFAVVGFAQESRSFCLRGDPVELEVGDASGELMRPSVSYVNGGFFLPGYERDGRTVDEASDGGWLIIWAGEHDGRSALLGTRVAELDGRPVHPDERLVMRPDEGTVEAPLAVGNGSSATVVYHAGGTDAFVTGRALACSPE